MKYIGIDGGISGALCALVDGKIIETVLMPIMPAGNGRNEYDCQAIIAFLDKHSDAVIILEKAQYTPALGGISAFSFGKSYGTMVGILSALKRRYHIVAARTWQSEMFRDINADNTKEASELIARRLFPEQNFRPTERSKKVHSGLTDAALLATYGQRHNL